MPAKTWNGKQAKLASNQSVFVDYAGKPLQSGATYYWQVKVWDNNTKTSAWSKPASFTTGFFNTSDWKAKWIEVGYAEDSSRPSPMFRKKFNTTKTIRSAVAFITAHGMYEAQINGKRVGDAYLTPGWTSYNKRLQYQAYDVTALLEQGCKRSWCDVGQWMVSGHLAWGE